MDLAFDEMSMVSLWNFVARVFYLPYIVGLLKLGHLMQQLIIAVPVGTGRVLAMMERKKVENM